MRKMNEGLRLMAVLAIAGCSAPQAQANYEVKDVFPGEDVVVETEVEMVPTVLVLPSRTPFPTSTRIPATETPVPTEIKLENPYFNKPFSQRCKQWFDDLNVYTVDCAEDWAERPLPGGCDANRFNNFMGRPSCNSAATSFVINYLVPAEVINEKYGQPGIDPAQLVWDIYPNLSPTDGQVIMDCGGAGPASIRGALHFFGLETEPVMLSKYTLVEIGESLAPNQRLMIGMIGINAKGRRFQHWTVYKRFEVATERGYAEYSGLVPYFDDSFFYSDQWTQEDVDFEISPNIGERVDGTKNFEIVGAIVVTSPYEMDEWGLDK